MRKIDAFCHVMPQPYYDRFFALDTGPHAAGLRNRVASIPVLHDMDKRFAVMDEFGDYRQLINIAAPPVETLGGPQVSREMSRLGNESMAELVRDHPDRSVGFCACVPLDDVDAAVQELDYAVNELGALGCQIYTHLGFEAMDHERFEPFWERTARTGGLLQVHPGRSAAWPDYPSEQRSRDEIWWTFGWEYDLSAFMARIVFSGVIERHPELKLLIHHGGGMVPHFSGRVGPGWDRLGARTPPEHQDDIEGYPLSKRPIEYFKTMYADTAMFGAAHALRCSTEFYGVDRMLFASDTPYDPEKGPGYIRATIANLQEIGLSEAEQEQIFAGNLEALLGLRQTA